MKLELTSCTPKETHIRYIIDGRWGWVVIYDTPPTLQLLPIAIDGEVLKAEELRMISEKYRKMMVAIEEDEKGPKQLEQ